MEPWRMEWLPTPVILAWRLLIYSLPRLSFYRKATKALGNHPNTDSPLKGKVRGIDWGA